MNERKSRIRSLYPFALAEGEGVGTAYEYVAKGTFLRPIVEALSGARAPRLLVAGLPEKYGSSLDFTILAHQLDADVLVVDDRPAALERAEKVVGELRDNGHLAGLRISYQALATLAEVSRVDRHDAVLSCEVLQRIPAPSRRAFAEELRAVAKCGAVFVPNSENASHLTISGLAGLSRAELAALFHGAPSGYVDMPPFPPGITRSAEQRSRASTGVVEAIAMRGLDLYCQGETLVPAFIKRRFAHIVCARWGA
jgi:hypothetical protein